MRFLRLVLPLVALTFALAVVFGPPPNLPRAQSMLSKPTPCCGGSAVGLRELDFPYYSLRDGFSSQLNLVSDSPHPIDLTLAIYSQHGASVLDARVATTSLCMSSPVSQSQAEPERRFYDMNIWSPKKRDAKLNYMHPESERDRYPGGHGREPAQRLQHLGDLHSGDWGDQ